MEDRDVDMSEIPKRGYKVTGYKGGRIPICNIDSSGNAMEISYICDLPSLKEVTETTYVGYISLFI